MLSSKQFLYVQVNFISITSRILRESAKKFLFCSVYMGTFSRHFDIEKIPRLGRINTARAEVVRMEARKTPLLRFLRPYGPSIHGIGPFIIFFIQIY